MGLEKHHACYLVNVRKEQDGQRGSVHGPTASSRRSYAIENI